MKRDYIIECYWESSEKSILTYHLNNFLDYFTNYSLYISNFLHVNLISVLFI